MRGPFIDKAPEFKPENDTLETFVFELITPMCGGDSESWELNKANPVRAQSVKGQLRFWWRTMQNVSDTKELLDRENRIWGGEIVEEIENGEEIKKSIKSPVQLNVIVAEMSEKNWHPIRLNGNNRLDDITIPPYVAFPVESAIRNDKKRVHYITELRFTLQIRYQKEHKEDVLNTLKLWTLFGGVGARTRRGCGSLYCEELLKEFVDEVAIQKFIAGFGRNFDVYSYPRIFNAQFYAQKVQDDPPTAWKNLIKKYKDFRQDRPDKNTSHPGRSFWPEPDAIRRLTNTPLPERIHQDGIWFPCAAYGLPVITKFNTHGHFPNDPKDTIQLAPLDKERWPSPIIIKVIKIPNGTVFQTVFKFNVAIPTKLELRVGKKPIKLDSMAVPTPETTIGKYMNKDMPLKKGETVYTELFKALFPEEVK